MKSTRTQNLMAAALMTLALTCTAMAQTAPKLKMTTEIPPEITTPDTIDTRSPLEPYYDRSWALPDIEKVK